MRAREIKEILEENYVLLTWKYEEARDPGKTHIGYKLKEYIPAIGAVLNLKDFEFLQTEINKLLEIRSIFNARLPEIIVSINDFNNFNNLLISMKEKISAVITAFNQVLPKQEETEINVKLPPLTTLKEMRKYLEKLDKHINQVIVNDKIEGEIEVKGVEAGSIWLSISLKTLAAVKLIGVLASVALNIRKQYYESELMREIVRAQKIKNDNSQAIKNCIEEILSDVRETKAKEALENAGIQDYDNDYLERVKGTIKVFTDLINNGAQIQPAISANEETKKCFPDREDLKSIEASVRLLSTGKEKEEIEEETDKNGTDDDDSTVEAE